ncbi:MAG: DMT family transporter [Saprospiraceae bacterium]|nr:DMT family transporter [Saprospiraceae bacterium]
MISKHKYFPYVLVALATLCISISGPAGRYMNLDPPFVIFVRCVIGFVVLMGLRILTGKESIRLPLKNKTIIFTSVVMCIHWVLFFYSLKYSNVAIAAVSVFTYPLQTIVIESVILKKRINSFFIIMGLLVCVGVFFLHPVEEVKNTYGLGIFLGCISGTMLAIRNIYSKVLLLKYSSNSTYLSQVFITCILLIPFSGRESLVAVIDNLIPLLLLGIVTTTIGHLLMMKSFSYFSASEVGLLISGQPVFAIIMAYFLLGEEPTWKVIIGAGIVLFAVFSTFLKLNKQK